VPIKKTDDIRQATKMVIPDFVCTAICAGLNLSDLIGEGLMIEPPEEKPVNNDPQLRNPHMNTEEGLHMNTFRYGYDDRVGPIQEELAHNLGEK